MSGNFLDLLSGTTTVTQHIATFGRLTGNTKPSSKVTIRRVVIVNEDATTTLKSSHVELTLSDGNGATSRVILTADVAADLADALDRASSIVRDEVAA